MNKFIVNTRCLFGALTGVQRYTFEVLKYFKSSCDEIAPKNLSNGVQGHAWEQLVLPVKVKNQILWSPANTGPLTIKKQVVTIHDVSPLDHPEWSSKRFSAWYQFIIPKLAQRVQHIITDSNFSKSRIIKTCKVDEDKVSVIPIGVDKRFTPKKTDDVTVVINLLGIPTHSYLLALGSIEPRKNLPNLLRAWDQLQGHISSDVWLVLAGAKGKSLVFGDMSMNKLPPRVYMTGYVPDKYLPALYSGAIASPYLSTYEGFGLPPLEAMASGTPVITGNISSLPEVVGDAGIMVNPNDVDEIANAIVTLVDDSHLRDNLRQKGLERSMLFDWQVCANRTRDIILRVTDNESSNYS